MTLTYDLAHDVAYLRLGAPGPQVRTLRVTDDVSVDLAPDGTVYGIELLHAGVQLGGGDAGLIVIVDELRGERRTLPIE